MSGAATTLQQLVGARVRRVDGPSSAMLALTLGGRGAQEVLVVGLDRPARGLGLVPERPRGQPASAFVRKLRKELRGAVLRGFDPSPGSHTLLVFERGPTRHTLAVELAGPEGNAVLLDDQDRVVVALRPKLLRDRGLRPKQPYRPPDPPPSSQQPEPPTTLEGLREQGGLLTRDRAADQLQAERAAVRRALRKARGRIDRKRRAIAQDAARAEHAPELRRQGSMIVTHLSQIEPGDRELTAMDWEADPPVQRTIELDPARDPHQQAEQLFHRARRLERGAEIASERDRAAREEREILQELEQELEQARDRETVQALAERAREEGVRGLPEPAGKHSAGGRHHPPRRQPFRTFQGAHGRTIRVGRGSADNDALTLHHARPRDLWLHARGQRGAHVVVPLDRDESCPPELLIDAATLAAHFSEARGEPKVEVQYTPRRFVRKPRGAPPGAVTLEREKVVNLRVEPDRLSRLLGHPH